MAVMANEQNNQQQQQDDSWMQLCDEVQQYVEYTIEELLAFFCDDEVWNNEHPR